MKLSSQLLFQMLNETKKMVTPDSAAVNNDGAPVPTEVETMFFITKHYDATKQLFTDLGFSVPENDDGWQIFPMFNHGRACPISRNSILFCLEECTDTSPSGPLYLKVDDVGVARLLRLQQKYKVTEIGRISLDSSSPSVFQLVPPDGGAVVFTAFT